MEPVWEPQQVQDQVQNSSNHRPGGQGRLVPGLTYCLRLQQREIFRIEQQFPLDQIERIARIACRLWS